MAAAVVMVAVSAAGWGVGSTPVAWAQVPPSVSGFPAGVWAPVSTGVELPPPLQMTSAYLPPVTPGQPPAVAIGFAGPFDLPEGPWRVSVGVGDPNGIWVRTTMAWDGTGSTGEALRLDGLLADDLGPVAVNVQTGGLVVIDMPDAAFDGSLGDAMWVEAVLGPDSAPDATVRSDWFARSLVFGEGAPGLVPGGRLGTVLGSSTAAVGTGGESVMVDTGAPAVVQVTGDVALVELGAPPTEIVGQAAVEVVDVVTFATDPAGPPAGPQVRVNRTTGAVDLTVGSLGGPVSLSDDGAPVVQADPSWLPSGAPGPADPATADVPSLTVDLAAAFDQLGLAPPGDSLAVSVTRVVSAADGAQVVAAGMAADRTWLDQGVAVAPVTTVVEAPIEETESGPVVLIAAGVVLGVVLVAVSIAVASALARRREARRISGATDNVIMGDGGTGASGGLAAGDVTAVRAGAAAPVDGDVTAGDGAPVADAPGWGVDPETVAQADDADAGPGPGAGPGPDVESNIDADAAAPVVPDEEPPVERTPPAEPLAALDDELDELSRRLRRLDGDDLTT